MPPPYWHNHNHAIATILHDYSQQGNHQTGSSVDAASAVHLQQEAIHAGATGVHLEAFPLHKVSVLSSSVHLQHTNRILQATPLYDCATYTSNHGIQGILIHYKDLPTTLHSNPAALVPVVFTGLGQGGGPSDIVQTLRQHQPPYAGIIVVADPTQSSCAKHLSYMNASSFAHPFGPPTVQCLPIDIGALEHAAASQTQRVTLVAMVSHDRTVAFNVVASVGRSVGGDSVENSTPQKTQEEKPALQLFCCTPRSGWGSCASERGGGLCGWLSAIYAAAKVEKEHPGSVRALFLASSGHELDHLGFKQWVKGSNTTTGSETAVAGAGAGAGASPCVSQRQQMVANATLCIHLGANIASKRTHIERGASGGNNPVPIYSQVSNLTTKHLATQYMIEEHKVPLIHVHVGASPVGEAREFVACGSTKWVSFVGPKNVFFHSKTDQYDEAIDVESEQKVALFCNGVADIVEHVCRSNTISGRRTSKL